ncbi:hypothetical protein LOD99_15936 [Oopsacas minuta]|uniref:Histone-lysine N-methyltransferase SETMAR n=1 Tax=Oopsacas minuta TaxID=111878 RepID=A0AAV7K809_9METZ|nr:hypothetical protein LOD99_15936 [Oopsacas minuta]
MNQRAKLNRTSGRDVMNLTHQGKGRKMSREENGNSVLGQGRNYTPRPEKTTIISDYYVDALKALRPPIKRERRGKLTHGVLLQHDNAIPHVCSKTMAAIDDLGFECLPILRRVQTWLQATTDCLEK